MCCNVRHKSRPPRLYRAAKKPLRRFYDGRRKCPVSSKAAAHMGCHHHHRPSACRGSVAGPGSHPRMSASANNGYAHRSGSSARASRWARCAASARDSFPRFVRAVCRRRRRGIREISGSRRPVRRSAACRRSACRARRSMPGAIRVGGDVPGVALMCVRASVVMRVRSAAARSVSARSERA